MSIKIFCDIADLNLIKKGAKKLLGKNDFGTFQASNCYSITSIKTMKKIKVWLNPS